MIIEVLLNQQVEHVSSFSSKVVHAPKDMYSLDFFFPFILSWPYFLFIGIHLCIFIQTV